MARSPQHISMQKSSLERCVESFMTSGDVEGCRFTSETPRRTSVLDWMMLMTGCKYSTIPRMFERIRAEHPEIMKDVGQYKFPGQGQRPTYVANALGLLSVFGYLPKKYSVRYHEEANKLMVRYLGGDTSIGPETVVIRAIQRRLPENHRMRPCGTDVEAGVAGNLASMDGTKEQQAAIAWNEIRTKAREATKRKSKAVSVSLPGATKGIYAQLNCAIGKAATGEAPRHFKTRLGIPNKQSARDHYTRGQLSVVDTLENLFQCIAEGNPGDIGAIHNKSNEVAENMGKIVAPYLHRPLPVQGPTSYNYTSHIMTVNNNNYGCMPPAQIAQ